MTDPERITALTQANAELRAALRLAMAQIRLLNLGTGRVPPLMKLLRRVYLEARKVSQ